MKILQIGILKIIACSLLFFAASISFAQNAKIRQADSLFKEKKYTQSLELYQSVFDEKKYSQGMLLKMAYINEGLGRVGPTLYFLKLYYLASDDEQALKKAEELAAKFGISGYEVNDSGRVLHWFQKNQQIIQLILVLALLGTFTVAYLQKKKQLRSWGALVVFVVLLAALRYVNNFNTTRSVIVTSDKIILMDGPSAGANVISRISEGNLLHLYGQEDVWLRVKWEDKEAYVKETGVKEVVL